MTPNPKGFMRIPRWITRQRESIRLTRLGFCLRVIVNKNSKILKRRYWWKNSLKSFSRFKILKFWRLSKYSKNISQLSILILIQNLSVFFLFLFIEGGEDLTKRRWFIWRTLPFRRLKPFCILSVQLAHSCLKVGRVLNVESESNNYWNKCKSRLRCKFTYFLAQIHFDFAHSLDSA